MVRNKFGGCCLGPRLSHGTTYMVRMDTNHFLSSQTQAEAHFSCFSMKIHQNRPQVDQKSIQNRSKIGPGAELAPGDILGSILVPCCRFWVDFVIRNRPKIAPESVSGAIMAQKHASLI